MSRLRGAETKFSPSFLFIPLDNIYTPFSSIFLSCSFYVFIPSSPCYFPFPFIIIFRKFF